MSVSFEKIEELKKRADISYEEAKALLEKHNGDVVEALIELEKRKKISPQDDHAGRFFSKLKKLFSKGNHTKFMVTKKGKTVADLPVNYLILALIFAFHLMIISLILIFITGCKMSIRKSEGVVMDVDDVIIDVSRKAKNAVKNFTEDDEASAKEDTQKSSEDGYNEYTVK